MRARFAIAAVLLGAALLVLPGLGAHGLWDPAEIRIADAARRPPPDDRPLLDLALVRAGFAALGAREWAGRLPAALCALASLALCAWVGSHLLSRRAGAIAALVLATCPAFLLDARHLGGHVLARTAELAAFGGLGVALCAERARARTAGWLLGLCGLAAGSLAVGAGLGAAVPLGAVAAAVAVCWRERAPGDERPIGRRLLVPAALIALAALAVGGAVAWAAVHAKAGYVPILGAAPDRGRPPTFDAPLRALAFAAFPWIGVMAAGWALAPARASGPRESLGRATVALAAAFGVIGYWAWSARFSEPPAPALAALALCAGALIDDVVARRGDALPVAGLIAAAGALIVGRDLFLSPEAFVPADLIEGASYPAQVRAGPVHLVAGIAFAVLALAGLAGLPAAPGAVPRPARLRGSPLWLLAQARRGAIWLVRAPVRGAAPRYLAAAAAVAVLHAGATAHWLVPALSRQLSHKAVFARYQELAGGTAPIARYRVPGRGADYYAGRQVEDLRSNAQALDFFGRDERVFLLVAGSALAALDHAARERGTSYVVVDDASERAMLLSNRLGPGEQDHNPLRRFVRAEPPKVGRSLRVDFDGKVEMIGFDLPDRVQSGDRFRVAFHFRVLDRLPANYKLFIHFDQPAYRFHGDHDPLGGRLPTQYWTPGSYVTDEHEVDVPRMTTPAGRYQVYMGFWQGDRRIAVRSGPQDGHDRVKLGSLIVE